MRVAELDGLNLDSPSRLDLAAIEAVMLWPDDADMRRRWLRAAEIEAVRPHVARLSHAALLHYTLTCDASPERLADLQVAAGKRQLEGMALGHRTLRAIAGTGSFQAIDKAYSVMRSNTSLSAGAARISVSQINKVLPRYRAVLHLWAAWDFMACTEGDLTFPCAVGGLGEFLANADQLRRWGEETTPRHSDHTIVRPADPVELPPELASRLPPPSIARLIDGPLHGVA